MSVSQLPEDSQALREPGNHVQAEVLRASTPSRRSFLGFWSVVREEDLPDQGVIWYGRRRLACSGVGAEARKDGEATTGVAVETPQGVAPLADWGEPEGNSSWPR